MILFLVISFEWVLLPPFISPLQTKHNSPLSIQTTSSSSIRRYSFGCWRKQNSILASGKKEIFLNDTAFFWEPGDTLILLVTCIKLWGNDSSFFCRSFTDDTCSQNWLLQTKQTNLAPSFSKTPTEFSFVMTTLPLSNWSSNIAG